MKWQVLEIADELAGNAYSSEAPDSASLTNSLSWRSILVFYFSELAKWMSVCTSCVWQKLLSRILKKVAIKGTIC